MGSDVVVGFCFFHAKLCLLAGILVLNPGLSFEVPSFVSCLMSFSAKMFVPSGMCSVPLNISCTAGS